MMRCIRPASALWIAACLLATLAGCATGPTGTPAPEGKASAPVATAPSAPAAVSAAPVAPAAASAAMPVAAAAEPVAVDPLRPEVRLDLDDRAAQTDLWTRLRAGFAMPDLDSPKVRNREQWYATRPDYVQRMTGRGSRYLFHIVEELDKRGMPTELALLPFIESAFNPEAMSSAKASGMWQFIPSTGRHFELTQNLFRDDRRDVLASTRAALDYLQKLYGMFGDWHLALAAYNWGEGSVQRAIERNKRAKLPTDYASLRMPNETAYYVPKLQAVKNIVARPADFGLTLPPLANHPYFLAVSIERDIDVDVAARLSGLPLDEFRALNPQMNKPVILAAGTQQVLLPYDNANRFVRSLQRYDAPLATWTAWVAPKTLSTADAARATGMHESDLREVNLIPPHMLVRAGSVLLVPRSPQRQADVPGHLAENAMMALTPDGTGLRKLSLKAGKRDSVASVARRYRVSASQVAHWNGVSAGSGFRPGQTILVYVSAKSVPGKSVRSAKTGAASKSAKASKTSKTSNKVVVRKATRADAKTTPKVAKN